MRREVFAVAGIDEQSELRKQTFLFCYYTDEQLGDNDGLKAEPKAAGNTRVPAETECIERDDLYCLAVWEMMI